ncbi:MAG: MFS transporter [Deltaproteobacteria bacterium]|nr:MFS transporter [Deltaproteobacteria bacterium]
MAAPSFSASYLRYALGLLCAVYVVNFVDRQILAILLPSIKAELSLTDTQLGLLSGTAFGLFYATLGVPIARLADRVSRKWVITVCLALWSGMTALCGSAVGFTSLLAFRVGVGVGEAGGSPPAHSMISDYFPPERRATALAIFSLGVPFGILVGFLAGGWLNEGLGWRRAFVVVGLPGLLLAVLVALTLREPPRGHSEGLHSDGATPSALDVIRFLWSAPTFRHLSLASGLYAFVGYSVINWVPSFLIRTHHMTSGEVGSWLALIVGVGGGIGNYLGGVLADRFGAKDARKRALVPAIAMAVAAPFSLVIYGTQSATIALVFLVLPTGLGLMYQAPAFAITQSLATPKMRATAAAVLLFVINIIGLALGPLATGALSDALEPRFGADSLRWALLIVSSLFVWSALHFYLASRTLARDFERAREAGLRESRGAV